MLGEVAAPLCHAGVGAAPPQEGWPLLPTAGGEAYALPAGGLGGSRVIDLAAVSDALVRGAMRTAAPQQPEVWLQLAH